MTAASAGTEVSDAEVLAQHNDLEMLRRSHLWPHGSLCPMKRRIGDTSSVDLIIVVDRGLGDPTILRNPAAHRYFVFEGPMGLAGRQLLASGNDFLLRTLVDSGWLVD
jgi:hypothetical protein